MPRGPLAVGQTERGGAPVPVGRPPSRPSPREPYNWFVTVGNAPTLQWNGSSSPDGAPIIGYRVLLYGNPGSAAEYTSEIVLAMSFQPPTIRFGTWHWAVQAVDNRGLTSEPSEKWAYTVYSPEVRIIRDSVQFLPSGDQELIGIKACTEGAAGLNIALSVLVNEANDGSRNGKWQILKQLGVPCFDTNPSVPDHPEWHTLKFADGPHVVRIEALRSTLPYDDPNVRHDVHDVVYTLPHRRPAAPELVAPASGAFSSSRTVTFKWKAATNATGYRIVASADSRFGTTLLLDRTVDGSVQEVSHTFDADHPAVYWKVIASNDRGTHDSDASKLGIDRTPPAARVTPLTAVSGQNVFLVRWTASDDVSGVDCTNVQVRDGAGGGWADWFGCTKLGFALFQGQDGHTYAFRARARDVAGNVGDLATGDGDTGTTVNVAAAGAWWNGAYPYKRPVSILNNAGVELPAGYPLRLRLDGSTNPSARQVYDASRSATRGDDVRVVYRDGTELDRMVLSFSSTSVDIMFRAAVPIPAGALDDASYALYYGNAAAANPPARRNEVLYPAVDGNTLRAYDMLEGAGLALRDASGRGDATMNSALGWDASGKFGPGVVVPGSDPSGPAIDAGSARMPANAFTVEFWLKRTAHYGGVIAEQIADGDTPRWRLSLFEGRLRFDVWPTRTAGSSEVQSSRSLDGQPFFSHYHHLAVTFDGRNEVRFYVDGRLDASRSLPQSGLVGSNPPLTIGAARQNGGHSRLGGIMSGFTLSEGVRTDFAYGQFADVAADLTVVAGTEYVFSGSVPTPTPTPTPAPTPAPTSAYRAAVLADNPAGYWRLGDEPGAQASDSSGHGHHGTRSGGVTSGVPGALAGDADTAFSFDGGGSAITTPLLQSAVSQYSVEAWIKTSAAGDVLVQARGPVGSGARSLSLWLAHGYAPGIPAGSVNFALDADGIVIGAATTQTVNDGRWHHVVGAFSGQPSAAVKPNQFVIYIDGTAAPLIAMEYQGASAPLSGAGGIKIGRHDAWDTWFHGSLDEVAIYTSALTAQRVAAHYQAGTR